MKKIFLSLAMALSGYCSYAQNVFPTPTGNVGIGTTNPNVPLHVSRYGNNVTGNLTLLTTFTDPTGVKGISLGYNQSSQAGIIYSENNTGTGSPLEFWTYNGSSFAPRMVFTQAGNLGFGTTSPGNNISFQDVASDSGTSGITWYNPDPLHYGIYRTSGSWIGPDYQQMALQWDTGILLNPGTGFGKSYVEVTGGGLRVTSGNVGVGTSTIPSGFALAVNGSAIATSMTVKLYNNWPDYVFKKEYKLPSLLEVKTYIDNNQHLPEMPSAQEVKDNGINLGEMNKVLTKKVEELTLYAIEQQKRINQLEEQQTKNEQQEARIAALEKALLKLTSR